MRELWMEMFEGNKSNNIQKHLEEIWDISKKNVDFKTVVLSKE